MKYTLMVWILALLLPGAARADLYQPYTALLERHVDEHGLVDYAGLKADRAGLDAFMQSLAALDPAEYASWTDDERLAFWINAYNAYILTLIIDHYPLQAALGRDRYPASSIQQINNPWSRKRYTVMRESRSPDAIEHDIIRKEFAEPRIHMALVCAAMSCPPLRREPYRGATLGAQLDDQCRRFFADLRNLQVDREKGEVFASRILDWFAEDFAPGAIEEHGQVPARRMAVAAAAGPYVDEPTRQFLARPDFKLDYFEYDWLLNERKP